METLKTVKSKKNMVQLIQFGNVHITYFCQRKVT